MRETHIIHTLNRDYNFLFCCWNTAKDVPDGLRPVFVVCCRFAKVSLFTKLLDRVPLPFPVFAVSCSEEHFLPFEHEPFDIQDRQSRYFSPAPFEEYAAAALSLDRSLRKPHVLLLLLEDVIDHGLRSLVDSGLHFSEQCLADMMSSHASWV